MTAAPSRPGSGRPTGGADDAAAAWRWRTDLDGRFVFVDEGARQAMSLPLIPATALQWRDIVLPGTDLEFLTRQTFTDHEVYVGLVGGIRRWVVSGRRDETDGSVAGTIVETISVATPVLDLLVQATCFGGQRSDRSAISP